MYEDVLRSMPSAPSVLVGNLYLIATAISSIVVVGIMLIVATNTGYKHDLEMCTCDCFDRRFKGIHFDTTNQYQQVCMKPQL